MPQLVRDRPSTPPLAVQHRRNRLPVRVRHHPLKRRHLSYSGATRPVDPRSGCIALRTTVRWFDSVLSCEVGDGERSRYSVKTARCACSGTISVKRVASPGAPARCAHHLGTPRPLLRSPSDGEGDCTNQDSRRLVTLRNPSLSSVASARPLLLSAVPSRVTAVTALRSQYRQGSRGTAVDSDEWHEPEQGSPAR